MVTSLSGGYYRQALQAVTSLLFLQITVLPPCYQDAVELVRSGGNPAPRQIEELLGLERDALSGRGWTHIIRSTYRVIQHKEKEREYAGI